MHRDICDEPTPHYHCENCGKVVEQENEHWNSGPARWTCRKKRVRR